MPWRLSKAMPNIKLQDDKRQRRPESDRLSDKHETGNLGKWKQQQETRQDLQGHRLIPNLSRTPLEGRVADPI